MSDVSSHVPMYVKIALGRAAHNKARVKFWIVLIVFIYSIFLNIMAFFWPQNFYYPEGAVDSGFVDPTYPEGRIDVDLIKEKYLNEGKSK